MEQAIKEQLIKFNPTVAAKLPKQEKKEVEALTTEQGKAFLAKAKETRHYTAYLVELATGLRRGELLALKWENIDLEAGTLHVRENLVIAEGRRSFKDQKHRAANET